MKPKGIYTNLENVLKVFKITRKDLMVELEVTINTVTRMLSVSSNISLKEAKIIRDYIQKKTGTRFELEFLFEEGVNNGT